ncbi:GNAT family N-acetyltransferase [Paenibacillus sp. GYB004]|uniref:GNAT family N-acetyltransferase n=1 Tax=Paenibacillus sp. GYB004 TaxID=2994393 RepID=UPI002F966714
MGDEADRDTGFSITDDYNDEDYDYVAESLYEYNVRETGGLLKKPAHDIHLFLRDESGRVAGGIFCETFSYCMYIDVFWIDELYRSQGCGKRLLLEAERAGKAMGCLFSHTSTFSYQAPEFYKRMGYEVFGVLDEYPDGIKQFFLKKRL